MHLAYVTTHQQNHTALDCSLCVNEGSKTELVKRLQCTLSQTKSTDLTSLTLFCLGVFHTASQADELTFQRGLEYLSQAVINKNKHAAHYLARIYSGCHQNTDTSSLRDQERAIQYYLSSFRLASYEALNDLMLSLRVGEGVIARDKDRWHHLFIQLYIEAGENKNNDLIPHLIRCLIQQDYVLSKTEPFLAFVAEIINSWMKTPQWNQHYTKLVQGYLEQEQKKGNQGSIYLFYKLDFFKSSQGAHFFNSTIFLSEEDSHFIQYIEELPDKSEVEIPEQSHVTRANETSSML
ncbi:hypothetical protein [Legionella sp. WA2022007384]